MKKLKWFGLGLLVIFIFTGAYFAGRMMSRPTIKSATQVSKSSSSASSSASSTSRASQSTEKLAYNTITPMQTAAAIAYYGQNKVHQGIWKHIFDSEPGEGDFDST